MNARQKAFCEFYAEDPDGTAAAIKAGYSRKTAASIASENLRKPELLAYIRQLQDKAAEIRLASATMAKAYLSGVMQDSDEKTSDRIRAAELLLKGSGAFVHFRDPMGRTIDARAGEGTVILLPPIGKIEDYEVDEEDEQTKPDPGEDPGKDHFEGWIMIE